MEFFFFFFNSVPLFASSFPFRWKKNRQGLIERGGSKLGADWVLRIMQQMVKNPVFQSASRQAGANGNVRDVQESKAAGAADGEGSGADAGDDDDGVDEEMRRGPGMNLEMRSRVIAYVRQGAFYSERSAQVHAPISRSSD